MSSRRGSQRSVSPGSMVRSTRKGTQGESAAHFGDDDELAAIRKRFQDVEERRLKEWENYQRSHRTSTEQTDHARAFLDINIGEVPAGRLVIELFEEAVPQTVENSSLIRAKLGTLAQPSELHGLHCHCARQNNHFITLENSKGLPPPLEST